MLEQYSDLKFRAEAVDWPLKTYVEYMKNSQDESPLYLFDRSFVEKMNLKVGEKGQYWSPECFGEDLFAVLGEQRPDSRWLIVGPERSGMNLEPSIAITQNFVPQAHLAKVLDFLKNKPDQVSGFNKDVTNAYDLFLDKVRTLYPALLETVMEEMESVQQGRKRKWDQLMKDTQDEVSNAEGFNFGFGDAEDEDVP
ncbi:hypothetical protein P7C71_g39, partial [Lecanoromycetidae sp. Uapishka_2]